MGFFPPPLHLHFYLANPFLRIAMDRRFRSFRLPDFAEGYFEIEERRELHDIVPFPAAGGAIFAATRLNASAVRSSGSTIQ